MKNPVVDRWRAHHRIRNVARVTFAALLGGASMTSLHAAAFSDHNWTGMGGYPGANDPVNASVVDASGHLYLAGGFTIVGNILATNIAKSDGTNWSALGSGINGGVSVLAVSGQHVYAAGYFTTAGGIPANGIAKWDGTNWAALGSGLTGVSEAEVVALAVSGVDVYVSGRFTNAGGTAVNHIAKWNGSNWSALGSGLNSPAYALAVSDGDLYTGGAFTNAGGVMVNRIARWNGSSWSALGSGLEGTYAGVSALAASGNNLYVTGRFSTAGGVAVTNMARWNGSSWSSFPWLLHDTNGQPIGASVHCLTISGNDLYAAGTAETDIWGSSYYGYVLKWNGSSWSPLGTGMDGILYDGWEPVVNTVAVSGSNVYAGGAFHTAGGKPASCLAKWNGNAWAPMQSSISMDPVAASGGNAYGAGVLTAADGNQSNCVFKWNGGGWSPIGLGANHYVLALAASGDELYAGGAFTSVHGVSANRIARWNGSGWSALGSGISGDYVQALAVANGELYAGGRFTNAGGAKAFFAPKGIAKWNGSHWSGLGSGIQGTVFAIAVSGTNVFGGGSFATAGGVPASNIARWDGSSWSSLSSGVDGLVSALAVIGGDLYTGGNFTTAGGIPVNGVAKWDGSSWSALDGGMTREDWDPWDPSGDPNIIPHIFALAVSGSDLYAGGLFQTAGGTAANYLAKWDGSNWSALGSGTSFGVGSLAVSSDELFAAGSFMTAGGQLAAGLARTRIGSRVQTLTASNSTATIRFSGVTGYEYDVQRTTSLTQPVVWTTLSSTSLHPAADGSFYFTDTNAPPGRAFYRASFSAPAQ